jgi:hypothetical protein
MSHETSPLRSGSIQPSRSHEPVVAERRSQQARSAGSSAFVLKARKLRMGGSQIEAAHRSADMLVMSGFQSPPKPPITLTSSRESFLRHASCSSMTRPIPVTTLVPPGRGATEETSYATRIMSEPVKSKNTALPSDHEGQPSANPFRHEKAGPIAVSAAQIVRKVSVLPCLPPAFAVGSEHISF